MTLLSCPILCYMNKNTFKTNTCLNITIHLFYISATITQYADAVYSVIHLYMSLYFWSLYCNVLWGISILSSHLGTILHHFTPCLYFVWYFDALLSHCSQSRTVWMNAEINLVLILLQLAFFMTESIAVLSQNFCTNCQS